MSGYPEDCFACGRKMIRPETVFLEDRLSNGLQYDVSVGPECFKHVREASPAGYQPPRGGPKLYFTASDAIAALAEGNGQEGGV